MATYRKQYFRINAYKEPVLPKGPTEIRIHGVNGAPPEELLNDPHPILVSGDDTAAFYRDRRPGIPNDPQPTEEGRSRSRRPVVPSDPKRTVEAYSWTGLNSRAASRAFWLLLFPFGMVNFAGWLLPVAWQKEPRRWRIHLARGLIRLLGITFTAHYALWVMVLAVDLLAVQCGGSDACRKLKWLGWFRSINEWMGDDVAHRMVSFTAVPLLLIGLLWLLGRRTAHRYDQYWPATAGNGREVSEANRWRLVDDLPLRTPVFWRAPHPTEIQAILHVAAAVATIGAVLAWTIEDIGGTTVADRDRVGWLLAVVVENLNLLGWILAVIATTAVAATVAAGAMHHEPDPMLAASAEDHQSVSRGSQAGKGHPFAVWRGIARWILVVGSFLLIAVGWAAWNADVTPTAPLPAPLPVIRAAFNVALAVELVLLLGLSLLVDMRLIIAIIVIGVLLYGSLDWEQPKVWWGLWLLACIFFVCVALVIYWSRSSLDGASTASPLKHLRNPFWIFVGLAAVVLIAILVFRTPGAPWWGRVLAVLIPLAYLIWAFRLQIHRGHDYPPSWQLRGGGPAAVSAVGAIGLTIMSAAAIVFFADQLGCARPAGLTKQRILGLCRNDSGARIVYPQELGWISAAGLAALIILGGALVVRIVALWWFRWHAAIQQIDDSFNEDSRHLGPDQLDEHRPNECRRLARKAAWARLYGALIDDADWLISAAVVALLSGAVSLTIDLVWDKDLPPVGLEQIVRVSSWGLGGVALGAIWLVGKARSDVGVRRAVGIVWEVTSFFPRRFHPLAPPSYAERSVPELRSRLVDLTEKDHVLLVAHSQGTLISVAALLTLLDDNAYRERIRRVALITYGCMLRRLFGRAYPLVVHQEDLIELKAELEGVPIPNNQIAEPYNKDFPAPRVDGVPRWMNFGRHSDYLGGRVFTELQRPSVQDRRDDIFFGDPTRRWRFRGQTQRARFWRHSFDYSDDAEDSRFAEHVNRAIEAFTDEPTQAPRNS